MNRIDGVENITEHIVQRSVNSSIIIFDIIAVIVWIGCLLYTKQYRPFYFCIIGLVVYYIVDAIIWMKFMGVRWIESKYNPYLLEIWLQLGPGVIHPSFAVLMLEGTFGPKRAEVKREFWVLLFILVQFTPCFLQQSFKFSDTIQVGRNMQSQRWLFLVLAILGYFYLIQQKMSVSNLWKMFLICFAVEGCFELSLYISDIRVASLKTMMVDSVLEFNVGAGLIFYLWKCMIPKSERVHMDYGQNSEIDLDKKV